VRTQLGSTSIPLPSAPRTSDAAPVAAGAPPRALAAPELSPLPDAPRLRPTHGVARAPESLVGSLRPAVAAVLLACAMGATAAHGADLPAGVPVREGSAVITPLEPVALDPQRAEAAADARTFDGLRAELDARLRDRRIDAVEWARARRQLHDALILRLPGAVLPRDGVGRIDLDALLLGDTQPTSSRGERALRQLGVDLERAMRITARDLVDPTVVRIEGAPGYKELSESELRRIATTALRKIPIGELPAGRAIAGLIRGAPGMDDVAVESLSYDELRRTFPRESRHWLKEHVEPLIDGHQVEVGLAGFAALTAARAASPDAAKALDALRIRVRVWSEHTEDGTLSTRGRLAWREGRVAPDLDVEAGAYRPLGSTMLHARLVGRIAPEASQPLTATATVGAHRISGAWAFDALSTYSLDTRRVTSELRASYAGNPDGWVGSGALRGEFGDGAAVGDASGRITAEVDLGREVRIGSARGDVSVFAGAGADSDGDNQELRGGVFFRLTF
jgi:hypothetical protein